MSDAPATRRLVGRMCEYAFGDAARDVRGVSFRQRGEIRLAPERPWTSRWTRRAA